MEFTVSSSLEEEKGIRKWDLGMGKAFAAEEKGQKWSPVVPLSRGPECKCPVSVLNQLIGQRALRPWKVLASNSYGEEPLAHSHMLIGRRKRMRLRL